MTGEGTKPFCWKFKVMLTIKSLLACIAVAFCPENITPMAAATPRKPHLRSKTPALFESSFNVV